MRELLARKGLPQPDEVEYRERSLALLWHEQKAAVVIDLDEPPDEQQRPSALPLHAQPRTRPAPG